MYRGKRNASWGLIAVLAMALGGVACSDDPAPAGDNNSNPDVTADTPVTDTPVTDTPVTDTPMGEMGDMVMTDMPMTDTPVPDAPVADTPVADAPVADTPAPDAVAEGACENEHDDAALTDELGDDIDTALGACGRGPCITCALSPEQVEACDVDGVCDDATQDCTLSACIMACLAYYEDEDAEDLININADQRAAIERVNAADLSDECTSCYGGITQCISEGGCGFTCANPGEACDTCQCEQGCPDAYSVCSGRDPYLECTE